MQPQSEAENGGMYEAFLGVILSVLERSVDFVCH